MIQMTRLNGESWWVSADQIESIEKTPDTLLVLLSGKRVMVKETPTEVIDRIVDYKRRIFALPELPVDNQGKENEGITTEEG